MIHRCPLTPIRFAVTFKEWQDSLRVESVITKSTHFVALLEYPRNSPHRAAWVSFLSCAFLGLGLQIEDLPSCLCGVHGKAVTAEQADLFEHPRLVPVD